MTGQMEQRKQLVKG